MKVVSNIRGVLDVSKREKPQNKNNVEDNNIKEEKEETACKGIFYIFLKLIYISREAVLETLLL